MKSFFLVLAIPAVLLVSCSGNHKDAKTDTSNYDTIKTDSGVTIIKNKEGKIINTVPTSSLNGNNGVTTNAKDTGSKVHSAKEYPYYIGGVLIHGEGGNITLDRLGVGNDIKPLIVQAANSEGRFGFDGTCSGPELMQLRLPAGNIQFIVRPKDTIDFTIVLEKPDDYKVYGSVESLQLEEVFNILNDANAKKSTIEDRIKASQSNRQLYVRLMDKRVEQYKEINKEKRATLMKFITKIDTSYVAILASLYLDPVEDYDFLKKLDDKLAGRYSNTVFYKSMHDKVATYAPVDIGKYAPEIISQTPEGKTVKLSSLRSKVVLLNFWVSYSPDSRKENPHFEKLYKKYKSKGFEILSYSVDKKKDQWTEAIRNDHMNWLNLSDLLGYQSAGSQTYVVNDVPFDFLIDRKGKIVAKNIYGRELDNKLEQLIK